MPVISEYTRLDSGAEAASDGRLAGAIVSDLMVLMLITVAVVGSISGRPLVSTLSALVFVLAVVARLWARLALEDVHFSCGTSSAQVIAGDEFTLCIVIDNRKPVPIPWLRALVPVQNGIRILEDDVVSRPLMGGTEIDLPTALGPYERVTINLRMKADKRGHYRFEPARLISGDLFGFYQARRELYRLARGLLVYPKTQTLTQFSLPPARPVGDGFSRVFVSEDPSRPASVREYRPGDPIKSIDWKTTARKDAPFVRTYDASMAQHVVMLLECDTPKLWRWSGRPEMLETCVTLAASVVVQSIELGYRVGLIANGIPLGYPAYAVVPPGRGPRQLLALMDALAVAQSFTLRSLDRVMGAAGGEATPYGATFVYVTGVIHRGTVEYLRLRSRRGHKVVVLYLGKDAFPRVPGLIVQELTSEIVAPDEVPLIIRSENAFSAKGLYHA